ncbi:MAG: tRNA (adenosine(37)-N6)-dimethylallyltransferase MiaA [Leptolyngbya sp. IPPAS B-1204]|nr:tRNA (adenosine(37)-N6)-dimethylallyltransferase MiaA [Elainella sp. C42_A2020_010]RNJ68471.1 MAG: tRNA (adenosine(37)-N6)-dimethylallyltransferase MiaA [Leptolyngbya sp. IPPAS B-1204]
MESALIVICGATATGKSGLALELARRFPSVILSADSRQVYREFDIGTAKPTRQQQQQVPHYLIDICDPTEMLTLADYQAKAQRVMGEIGEVGVINSSSSSPSSPSPLVRRGSRAASPPSPPSPPPTPLLVGGTGLYIKSIVRGMQIPRVAPQPDLRKQFTEMGQAVCYRLLQQVDPIAAAKIHPNDQVRTQRALEVFYVSGKPISQQQGERPPTYPILQIGLDVEMDALEQRIWRRTAEMIEAGFVAEVEALCQKYGPGLPLLNTLGYQEMKRHLTGELSLKAAEAEIVLHTRQFAKQQRTWFRADPTIEWFNADDPNLTDRVWQRLQEFLASRP